MSTRRDNKQSPPTGPRPPAIRYSGGPDGLRRRGSGQLVAGFDSKSALADRAMLRVLSFLGPSVQGGTLVVAYSRIFRISA
jgi:hypothetical protein